MSHVEELEEIAEILSSAREDYYESVMEAVKEIGDSADSLESLFNGMAELIREIAEDENCEYRVRSDELLDDIDGVYSLLETIDKKQTHARSSFDSYDDVVLDVAENSLPEVFRAIEKEEEEEENGNARPDTSLTKEELIAKHGSEVVRLHGRGLVKELIAERLGLHIVIVEVILAKHCAA